MAVSSFRETGLELDGILNLDDAVKKFNECAALILEFIEKHGEFNPEQIAQDYHRDERFRSQTISDIFQGAIYDPATDILTALRGILLLCDRDFYACELWVIGELTPLPQEVIDYLAKEVRIPKTKFGTSDILQLILRVQEAGE